ncbi:MAG: hypothetical protein AAGA85_03170 [Bacteroidota bacterium]
MAQHKHYLLLLGFLLPALAASAQEFSLGVTLGASYPSVENFDFANDDGLDGLGIHGGVLAQYRFGQLGGTASALYAFDQFSGVVAGFDTDYYYSRLVLPISFKYYIGEGFNFQLGASLGILLTAESETTVESQIATRYDISLTTSSTDFGGFFGFGYDAPVGISFNLTYQVGATDFPSIGERLSGPALTIGYYIFKSGSVSYKTPTIKGKKWKPGRSRSKSF